MTLVFNTPSKRCPFRVLNGKEVTIYEHLGHRRLKRLGGQIVPVFSVLEPTTPGGAFIALGDELHIVP